MTNEPIEYTAWYDGCDEVHAEKFPYPGHAREPWQIAEVYAQHYHDGSAESPHGITVHVKHTLTEEVTSWRIVVEYDPSYYANPVTK